MSILSTLLPLAVSLASEAVTSAQEMVLSAGLVHAVPRVYEVFKSEGVGAALKAAPQKVFEGFQEVYNGVFAGAKIVACAALLCGILGASARPFVNKETRQSISAHIIVGSYIGTLFPMIGLLRPAVELAKSVINFINVDDRVSLRPFKESAKKLAAQSGPAVGALLTFRAIATAAQWGLG